MDLTATVDKDLCMSSGLCIADYPAAFRFDDDELAETTTEAANLTQPDLKTAARNCPAEAIILRNGAGEQVDPFD